LAGDTTGVVALAFGVSKATVNRIAHDAGLIYDRRDGGSGLNRGDWRTRDQMDRLRDQPEMHPPSPRAQTPSILVGLRAGKSVKQLAREIGVSYSIIRDIALENGMRWVGNPGSNRGNWIDTQEAEPMKEPQPWDDDAAGYADLLTPERERPAPVEEAPAPAPTEPIRTILGDDADRVDHSSILQAYRLLDQATVRFDEMEKQNEHDRAFGQEWYEKAGVEQREHAETKKLLNAKINNERAMQSEIDRLNERLKLEISNSEKLHDSLLRHGMTSLQERLNRK
jgi:hypothetical protein